MTHFRRFPVLSIAILLFSPVNLLAEGDVEAGAKVFNKCRACHAIVSPEGDVIEKGGRTGPNLFGLGGRQAGSVEGYRYGKSLVQAGEAGLEWNEESFVAYTADPRAFLREITGDNVAKSKMAFRLKKGAEDVFSFINSVSSDRAAIISSKTD